MGVGGCGHSLKDAHGRGLFRQGSLVVLENSEPFCRVEFNRTGQLLHLTIISSCSTNRWVPTVRAIHNS